MSTQNMYSWRNKKNMKLCCFFLKRKEKTSYLELWLECMILISFHGVGGGGGGTARILRPLLVTFL